MQAINSADVAIKGLRSLSDPYLISVVPLGLNKQSVVTAISSLYEPVFTKEVEISYSGIKRFCGVFTAPGKVETLRYSLYKGCRVHFPNQTSHMYC